MFFSFINATQGELWLPRAPGGGGTVHPLHTRRRHPWQRWVNRSTRLPRHRGLFMFIQWEFFFIQSEHFHKNRSMYDLERGGGSTELFFSENCEESEIIYSSLIIVWHIGWLIFLYYAWFFNLFLFWTIIDNNGERAFSMNTPLDRGLGYKNNRPASRDDIGVDKTAAFIEFEPMQDIGKDENITK